ncbi:hypothetical protein AGR4C_Cc120278 [Agrobacterium tumefaciens str. Kerr 14]|uniref:Uncharacterized protein n=1 Tax=Agrobacterium tumefaciens str. Kerr 14 TaxID=1183424 RepID=A0A1S7NUP5_AGRTU|nr:hypothetical protein AGR4C_Cc120278 [Agrobacterium tumefaciens str. Kerr 14]
MPINHGSLRQNAKTVHPEMLAHAISIRQGSFHLTFPEMVIPAISRPVKPLRARQTRKFLKRAAFCGLSPNYPLFRTLAAKGNPKHLSILPTIISHGQQPAPSPGRT